MYIHTRSIYACMHAIERDAILIPLKRHAKRAYKYVERGLTEARPALRAFKGGMGGTRLCTTLHTMSVERRRLFRNVR